MSKATRQRPDFSNFLAHFTSEIKPKGENNDAKFSDISNLTAFDKLVNILNEKKIFASKMPWTSVKAVCFTECPWSSLIEHTKNYSCYGLGFKKGLVYSKHGGPVFYIRPDHYEKQKERGWDEQVFPFLTPFIPSYRPKSFFGASKPCDYTHEREWRVPHDFPFEYQHIEFVVLNDYQDMAAFPKQLKDEIGRDKFLLMENYTTIERLWPVHNLGI